MNSCETAQGNDLTARFGALGHAVDSLKLEFQNVLEENASTIARLDTSIQGLSVILSEHSEKILQLCQASHSPFSQNPVCLDGSAESRTGTGQEKGSSKKCNDSPECSDEQLDPWWLCCEDFKLGHHCRNPTKGPTVYPDFSGGQAGPVAEGQDRPKRTANFAPESEFVVHEYTVPVNTSSERKTPSQYDIQRLPSVITLMRRRCTADGSCVDNDDDLSIDGVTSEASSIQSEGCSAKQVKKFQFIFFSVLDPTGPTKTKWDIFLLFILSYICLVFPYDICFGIKKDTGSTIYGIDSFINSVFALDIYLNFRTGVLEEDNNVVYDNRVIAKRYLKGWFTADILSIIPFDEMLTSNEYGLVQLVKAARVAKIAKVLRMVKVIKMMRVLKSSTAVKSLERIAGHNVFRIVYFTTAAMFVLHWMACMFYYASYVKGLGPDTWVSIMGLKHKSNVERYITALYWAMSTLATVGYGDVIPGNALEKIVSMIGMTIGVTVFGYFMSAMGTMLTTWNRNSGEHTRRMQMVDDFVKLRKIPDTMAERIRSFFSFMSTKKLLMEEEDLMKELSVPLRTEMVMFLYRDALSKVPFFKNKDSQFIVSIVTRLRLEYFSPGDVVVRQGDPGNVMYFLGEGTLQVRLYYDETESHQEAEDIIEREMIQHPSFKASETPLPDTILNSVQLKPPPLAAPASSHKVSAQAKPQHHSSRLGQPVYKAIGLLEPGEYFGEYSCLLGDIRTATVVALDYCELYSLSRQDLDKVLEDWPDMCSEFQSLIEDFVNADHVRHSDPAPPIGVVRAKKSKSLLLQKAVKQQSLPPLPRRPISSGHLIPQPFARAPLLQPAACLNGSSGPLGPFVEPLHANTLKPHMAAVRAINTQHSFNSNKSDSRRPTDHGEDQANEAAALQRMLRRMTRSTKNRSNNSDSVVPLRRTQSHSQVPSASASLHAADIDWSLPDDPDLLTGIDNALFVCPPEHLLLSIRRSA